MKKLILIALLSAGVALAEDAPANNQAADMTAHKAKIEQAIKERNYEAWKTEHEAWRGNSSISQKVTKDNFEKFAQMIEARQKGDMVTAQKIKAELGVQGMGKGNGQGKGQGMGKGNGQGKGNCTKTDTEKGQKMGQGKGQGGGKGMKHHQ